MYPRVYIKYKENSNGYWIQIMKYSKSSLSTDNILLKLRIPFTNTLFNNTFIWTELFIYFVKFSKEYGYLNLKIKHRFYANIL